MYAHAMLVYLLYAHTMQRTPHAQLAVLGTVLGRFAVSHAKLLRANWRMPCGVYKLSNCYAAPLASLFWWCVHQVGGLWPTMAAFMHFARPNCVQLRRCALKMRLH